jgi:hypothetical protein
MINATDLAECIVNRVSQSKHALNVYWYQLTKDRDGYARELRGACATRAIAVLVLRENLFTNPNSILSDLMTLLNGNREAVLDQLSGVPALHAKVAIVLLARTELGLPQLSSPAEIPDWLPIARGNAQAIVIEDITWTADGPLNASEAQVGEICTWLYELEKALCRRMASVAAANHNAGNSLHELFRKMRPSDTYGDILHDADAAARSVQNPSAFRPSVREKTALVALLWGTTQRHSADEMAKCARALGEALLLEESAIASYHETLQSVLARPADVPPTARERFARNVLTTVSACCQLITGAAHADYYRKYPIPLLRSVSYDLRQSLAGSVGVLAAAGSGVPPPST